MLQVPATVEVGSPAAAWTVHLIDISKAGVAFAISSKLDSGTSFFLSFMFPGADKASTAEGTVVYCGPTNNPALFRVGATLEMMSEETQEQIADFVTAPLSESEKTLG
jgi:hypothetical protein